MKYKLFFPIPGGLILIFFVFFTSVASSKTSPEYKLDHRLRALIGGVGIAPQSTDALYTHDNRILVYARLNTNGSSALEQLMQAGLQIRSHFGGLVYGSISASNLFNLASLDIVSTIFPYQLPVSMAFQGEGGPSLRADVVKNTKGLDGSGIKVGIISNSFGYFNKTNPTAINEGTAAHPKYKLVDLPDSDGNGIPELTGSDLQLTGDLPPVVEILKEPDPFLMPYSPRDPSGKPVDVSDLAYDDEARALAEVVCDVAPGVDISYHHGTTIPDMAQGIIDLAKAGCKVIVDDQFFAGQPIYQDDEISQSVEKVVKEYDVVYVTAAGNSGDASIESAYLDVSPDAKDPDPLPVQSLTKIGNVQLEIPQKNDLHNWDIILRVPQPDPYLDLTLTPGASAKIILYWENPFSGTLGPGASTDYDMYLLDEPDLRNDTILDAGVNSQGTPEAPMGDPVEQISNLVNSGTEPKTFYLALNLRKGPAANFKIIFVHNPRLTLSIQGDVISADYFMQIGHQRSPYALTCAASNYREVDSDGAFLGSVKEIDVTYYSSHGGFVPILFSPVGQKLAEGTQIFKPDITSVDGVNSTFFLGSGGDYAYDADEMPNFLGTSCAAPHAAGVMALMRQANPSLSSEQIRQWAHLTATDINDPGVDSNTGWGLLYADDAVNGALQGPPPTDTKIPWWEGY